MSDFASAKSAATVEKALSSGYYDAVATLRRAYDGADREEQWDLVLALAEAATKARTFSLTREITIETADADDVLCGWRWGEKPEFDRKTRSVGIPVLFGRRTLRLWFPITDLAGIMNSYLGSFVSAEIKSHLAPEVTS